MRLKDKVAIVTGAASGNGLGIALRFVEEGARVVVADVSPAGDDAVVLLRNLGGEAVFARTDVTSAADVQRMVKMATGSFGRLDILVNNAGISPAGSVTEISEDDWDRVIAVDLKSVFLGCKYAIPVMVEAGGGAIVNIAGTLAFKGLARKAAYCAAKAAVANLTRQMAIDYGAQGVRVNAVCPGFIDTPLNAGFPEEARKRLVGMLPVPRAGTVQDIANATLYLAGDESSYVTGTFIVVDGGRTAG